MKHEFKPGDPVMVEGKIISTDSDKLGSPFGCTINFGEQTFWMHKDAPIHPIPTPPRPLRVDELEHGKEYSFNHCGKQQGDFIAIFDGKAVMGVRHPDIPSDFTNRSVLLIDETANIRPVERVVTKKEVAQYFGMASITRVFSDALYATVRHFMKGGEK